MTNYGRSIRLSFYRASDGLRVMFFGPLYADFASLQRCFRKIAASTVPVQMDTEDFIVAFSGIKIRALSSGAMLDISKIRQGFHSSANSATHFQWACTNERWEYLAELIDGLIESTVPGHLYLTHFPDEDAIVVVSKGEYSDSVLSAFTE
jgi:hypothetical protein